MNNLHLRPVIIDSTVAAFLTRYQQAMGLAETESEKTLINSFAQNFIYIYGNAKANDAAAATAARARNSTSWRQALPQLQSQPAVPSTAIDLEIESRFFMFDALLHQLEQARSERAGNKRLQQQNEKLIALGHTGITRANRLTDILDDVFNRVPDLFKVQITQDDFQFLRTAAPFSNSTAGFSLRDILDSVEKSKHSFRVLPESGAVASAKGNTLKPGVIIFVHDLIGTVESGVAIERKLAKFDGISNVAFLHYNNIQVGTLRHTVEETITGKLKHYPESNPQLHLIITGDHENANPTRLEVISDFLMKDGPSFYAFGFDEVIQGVHDEVISSTVGELNANRADLIMDHTSTGGSMDPLALIHLKAVDLDENEKDPAVLWAHIRRLQAEVKGPEGFETWQHHSAMMHNRATEAESKVAVLERTLKEANEHYALEISLRNELEGLFNLTGTPKQLPTYQYEQMRKATDTYLVQYADKMKQLVIKNREFMNDPSLQYFSLGDSTAETAQGVAGPTPEADVEDSVSALEAAVAKLPTCMCPPPDNTHPLSYQGAVCPGCSQIISMPEPDLKLTEVKWEGGKPSLSASVAEVGGYSNIPKS